MRMRTCHNAKMNLNLSELAWAAGFFDGEGTTTTQHSKRRLSGARLSVSQVHREPLDRFRAALCGLGRVHGPYKREGNRRPQYIWRAVTFEHVQASLCMLWPFLCSIKRKQAIKVLAVVAGKRAEWNANPPWNSKRRTVCKHGHPVTTENIYIRKNGVKACVECRRRNTRESATRRRARLKLARKSLT